MNNIIFSARPSKNKYNAINTTKTHYSKIISGKDRKLRNYLMKDLT